jgi:hypothetical protein
MPYTDEDFVSSSDDEKAQVLSDALTPEVDACVSRQQEAHMWLDEGHFHKAQESYNDLFDTELDSVQSQFVTTASLEDAAELSAMNGNFVTSDEQMDDALAISIAPLLPLTHPLVVRLKASYGPSVLREFSDVDYMPAVQARAMRERAVRLADAFVGFESGSSSGRGGSARSYTELLKRIDEYHDGISVCLGNLHSCHRMKG